MNNWLNMYNPVLPVNRKSIATLPSLLCKLPAGESTEAFDEYEDHDPAELVTGGKEGIVSCIITGDSMIPYIHSGYRVYIDPFREVQKGDPVAAWINGEITAKFFDLSDRGLYLVSGNDEFAPRKITRKDDFRIIGVIEWFVGRAERKKK